VTEIPILRWAGGLRAACIASVQPRMARTLFPPLGMAVPGRETGSNRVQRDAFARPVVANAYSGH